MALPLTLVIPTEMCLYALKNRFVRQFQVYVYLKSLCSGKIILGKKDLERIAIDLGLKSIKTVKDCINELLKKNWMGFSKRSGHYFIKGFDEIRQLCSFYFRGAAEFCIDDIQCFKEFLTAVVIGSLINTQKSAILAVERKMGRSKTPAGMRTSKYFPIANKALSEILNVSISTAYELKRASKNQGFIKIRNNREIVVNIKPENLNEFKKYGNTPRNIIRCSKGRIFLQLPDLCYSKIHFRRRKKLMMDEIN